jgi:hypothetical protein
MDIPLEPELTTPQPFASGTTNVYKVILCLDLMFCSNTLSFQRI